MFRRNNPRVWNANNRTKNNVENYRKEHSNRSQHATRRVSFKTSRGSGRGYFKGKNAELSAKAFLAEDESMEGRVKNEIRNNDVVRRRNGSPIPKKKLLPNTTGWFRVIIPHGHKYEKSILTQHLANIVSPNILTIYLWTVEIDSVSFYVDDYKVAERIFEADRTILLSDGFRMLLIVRNNIPKTIINDKLKEKMKVAMSRRYNAEAKSLDLTKFHSDPYLLDSFCALFRPPIMVAAINIISENIPDIVALNLANNNMHFTDHFKNISEKLPKLEILYLTNNRIQSVHALEPFAKLNITELFLKGNPVKERYRDNSSYVSEIRRRFPKILKLDGEVLPPVIGFDVVKDIDLPEPKATFMCNSAGASIIKQFIEEYFKVFDSNNRQPLLAAYNEEATFTLTLNNSSPGSKFPEYWNENRNLLRMNNSEQRLKNVKHGRLQIVSFLQEFSHTQHDISSFSVDVTIVEPTIIQFNLLGVYKEILNDTNSTIRAFQRAFVLIPSGNGVCIQNELMYITNPTPEQKRKAFQSVPLQTNDVPIVQNDGVNEVIEQANNLQMNYPDEAIQLQMIQALSAFSKMNLTWSKKCLVDVKWNYQTACVVFSELFKKNAIPAEAFIH